MRTYWFEIFECVRKILLIGLPIFLPNDSPEQLVIGLIICFVTFGAYMMYAPFEDDGDDLLSQICQLQIFFSLLSKIILTTNPNNPMMSVLLPIMIGIPPVAAFIFESGVLDELSALMAAADNGIPIPCSGGKRIGVGLRASTIAKLEAFFDINPSGTLQVHLLSASGLKAADGDASDPYVVATLGESEKQSKVVEKTLEPTFDEVIEFDVAALEGMIANGLTLTVYDKNMLRFDVNLGEALVPLDALRKHASLLPTSAALSEQGSIVYSLRFIKCKRGMAPKEQEAKKEPDDEGADSFPFFGGGLFSKASTAVQAPVMADEPVPKKTSSPTSPTRSGSFGRKPRRSHEAVVEISSELPKDEGFFGSFFWTNATASEAAAMAAEKEEAAAAAAEQEAATTVQKMMRGKASRANTRKTKRPPIKSPCANLPEVMAAAASAPMLPEPPKSSERKYGSLFSNRSFRPKRSVSRTPDEARESELEQLSSAEASKLFA